MNAAFRAKSTEGHTSGFILVGVIFLALGLLALSFYVYRLYSSRRISDSNKLLSELCRAYKLTGRQRRLLKELAQARSLEDPCDLLLTSEHWMLDPERDPKFCRPAKRERLKALHGQLFTKAQVSKEESAGQPAAISG